MTVEKRVWLFVGLWLMFLDNTTFANTSTTNDYNHSVTTIPSGDTTQEDMQFLHYLNLTTDDMLRCFNADESVLNISAQEVVVYYFQAMETDVSDPENETMSCLLRVMAPEGSVLYVRFLEQTCTRDNAVSVYDVDMTVIWTGCESLLDPPSDVLTSGHVVSVEMAVGSSRVNYSLRMKIFAMPSPGKPELELRYLSDKQGYLQTPRWQQNTGRESPSLKDSRIQIVAPPGHVIFVSFVYIMGQVDGYFRCEERVELLTGEGASQRSVWSGCDYLEAPLPAVLEASVFHVHYTSDTESDYMFYGFRLLFSFHEISSAPQQLETGKWNCSVPNWPEFRPHLLCNLETECEGGEDEAQCSYTDSRCGEGRISAGGSCFILARPENGQQSWNQANLKCTSEGGRLALLNTPEKWRGFFEVIQRIPINVFVGLKSRSANMPHMYKYSLVWDDGTIAYLFKPTLYIYKEPPSCAEFRHHVLTQYFCDYPQPLYRLCEVGPENETGDNTNTGVVSKVPEIRLSTPTSSLKNITSVQCTLGHLTHGFLACDEASACWTRDSVRHEGFLGIPSSSSCPAPMTPLPPSFSCASGVSVVPYSVVCDHRDDCPDASDENFCVFPVCTANELQCDNQQCVPVESLCDGPQQCVDGTDEALCDKLLLYTSVTVADPPAVVHLDGKGDTSYTKLSAGSSCPETHFQCPGGGYCLPVYVRCNGVYDCPDKEDEAGCDSYTCPGFYRCRASAVCLHPDHVCDGVFQCPQEDDELFCDLDCPEHCTCFGLAFTCWDGFRAESFPDLRYLAASHTDLSPRDLATNNMLILLDLSGCDLRHMDYFDFPNLRSLDLSDNLIQVITVEHLALMQNLETLILAGNPLLSLFQLDAELQVLFPSLHKLDLSRTEIYEVDVSRFPFPNLRILNLSASGVEQLPSSGFQALSKLSAVDLRGCPMTRFPQDVFTGLHSLQHVHADNYRLCCPATLPEGFNINNCQAPTNEISSCDDLLRSDVYRVFLSVFSAFALVGNLGSFIVRVFVQKSGMRTGFGIFVTHLCVSDFLMGLYLAIIGVADLVYKGGYLWADTEWRHSTACKVAGFLSLLSSEVSAFMICLVTLDRFLVLRFPFSSLHFKKRSAHVTSSVVWLVGVALAAVPLVMEPRWQFYSQTGICIPLPITRTSFPGQSYSFGVMIVLNFVLFLLIAAGQVSIYASIRANRMSTASTSKKSQDLSIARRLITVAASDFLCWFPIGLLGILAAQGTPVPGEVNVSMAIFVLPLNSALNPFLYTLNTILEKRRRAQEDALIQQLMAKQSVKSTRLSSEEEN